MLPSSIVPSHGQPAGGRSGEPSTDHDRRAWEQYTVVEAKRIMKRHGIEPGGGIPALKLALQYRLYSYLNVQETIDVDEIPICWNASLARSQACNAKKVDRLCPTAQPKAILLM